MIECRWCKGAGWVRRDVDTSHADFGKPIRCMACNPPTEAEPAVPSIAERRRWVAS